MVDGSRLPENVTLLYRGQSGLGSEWEDVNETMPLEWTPGNFGGETLVYLPPSGMRPEGRHSVRAG